MDAKRINHFLAEVAANNNRPWFQNHKEEYEECKLDFERGVGDAIVRLAQFDPEIASLTPRNCCYRFYRDVRFSPDKSPYKRHFGAYICAHGKKSLRGGYYIHIQPGRSVVCAGCYWLPTNILTSTRNEIMARIDEWRKMVENPDFVEAFGRPGDGVWDEQQGVVSEKGFGGDRLKTCPKGFPKDYPFMDYLRMKSYVAWQRKPDDFFQGDAWLDELARLMKLAKPMMDFINSVVDDYE